MKQTTIVAIILGVLVLISLVQAFQLNNLGAKVSESSAAISTPAKSSTSSATTTASTGGTAKRTSSLPSSIKDLPQMVGGC